MLLRDGASCPRPYHAAEARRGVSQHTADLRQPGFTNRGNRINVTFIDKDGTKVELQVAEGDNLLDIAQANDLEMEGMFISVRIAVN